MQENSDQNNSKYGHFLLNEVFETISNMETLTWLQVICLMHLFQFKGLFNYTLTLHFVKSVRIWSFSGPHQSEYGKMGTRKTPNTDTFHAVLLFVFSGLMKMVAACFYLSLVAFIVIAGK